MDLDKLKAALITEEGVRYTPYKDTAGVLTVGVGHNLSTPLSPRAVDQILTDDIQVAVTALQTHAPWWAGLPDPQQRALVDLCFNMGWPTLSTFGTFLGLMAAGQYAAAALDLRDTAWYREVGTRGPRVVSLLLEGVVSTPSNA